MALLIQAPEWFYGIDALFDIVSLFVALLVAYYGYRVYKLGGQGNVGLIACSFFLLAFSFLFKIVTNLGIYIAVLKLFTMPLHIGIAKIETLYLAGYFFHRFLFLFGLLFLLKIALNIQDKRIIWIFILFIIMSTFFANNMYYLFHLISLLFLWYVCGFFWRNFKKKQTKASRMVVYTFILMFLSHLAFVFVGFHNLLYVIGEAMQLLGFLTLLSNYVLVLKR